MSVLVTEGAGRALYCKGAPEKLLPLCSRMLLGAATVPLDAALREALVAAQEDMAGQGLRLLSLAWKPLPGDEEATEQDLVLCGVVGLEDPPRAEVPEAITRCHAAGVRVIMVTGDRPQTALAIGREIGLVRGAGAEVLLGDAVQKMSLAQLQLALEAPELIFARVSAA